MGEPIDLEEQSNASFGSASHTKAAKAQTEVGGKRKLIYWDHFEDIINPTTNKIKKAKCK